MGPPSSSNTIFPTPKTQSTPSSPMLLPPPPPPCLPSSLKLTAASRQTLPRPRRTTQPSSPRLPSSSPVSTSTRSAPSLATFGTPRPASAVVSPSQPPRPCHV